MRSDQVTPEPESADRLDAALDMTGVLLQDQRALFHSSQSASEATMRLSQELQWYRSAVHDNLRRLQRIRRGVSVRLSAQRDPWR